MTEANALELQLSKARYSADIKTIDSYCELRKTSLIFKRDVTKDEWLVIFKSLKEVEGCIQFWIGDCLAYRQQKWGMYEDAVEETGMDVRTLREYKQVAENVKSGGRLPDLSFSHHAEVASLPEEEQKKFLTKASEEKLSVRELRQEIRNNQHKDKKPALIPKGEFNIIYCDPPWQYDFAETDSRKIENQYPTMTVDELCGLTLPNTSDDALLLMWATAPKLCEALKIIEAWGYIYKTHSIWDKEKIGMGYWFRGQHELLLVATKGNFSPPNPDNRYSSVYREARQGHSVKPQFYYEWIEKTFDGNKIELFARSRREGWNIWGNESI